MSCGENQQKEQNELADFNGNVVALFKKDKYNLYWGVWLSLSLSLSMTVEWGMMTLLFTSERGSFPKMKLKSVKPHN